MQSEAEFAQELYGKIKKEFPEVHRISFRFVGVDAFSTLTRDFSSRLASSGISLSVGLRTIESVNG